MGFFSNLKKVMQIRYKLHFIKNDVRFATVESHKIKDLLLLVEMFFENSELSNEHYMVLEFTHKEETLIITNELFLDVCEADMKTFIKTLLDWALSVDDFALSAMGGTPEIETHVGKRSVGDSLGKMWLTQAMLEMTRPSLMKSAARMIAEIKREKQLNI